MYTTILLCNTGSGRFTLIYHEDSTERSLDPVEFKRSFLPVDCTLHQVEPWLTFKSWASWLVLKKKCQVIIDRNFCRGKTNTWNLYYPQGRAATEERHLQNNSFLLLVYWSDQTLYHHPLPTSPSFFYKFLGQSCQGHCLITLGLDQSCKSKRESRRTSFLTVWGLNFQQHLRIIGTEPRPTGPTKGFSWVVGGGQAAEPVVIWKTEYRGQIRFSMCRAKIDDRLDKI